MSHPYQIAIIGAGPGGYVAAIRAAQLGFKTICIDKRKQPGGTCLNIGCIPSKSLLEATDLLKRMQEKGEEFGIHYSGLSINFTQMMERKDKIVKGLTEGVRGLFQKNGVEFLEGNASFLDEHTLEVTLEGEKKRVEADYFLIATGSDSVELPFLPFDDKRILSSTAALALEQIPKKMVVIGGGVIGVELASVYQRLGCEVKIVEMLDQVCAMVDETLSKQLLQSLKKQGIGFFLSSRVISADLTQEGVSLKIGQEDKTFTLHADHVLVAVGRKPFTEGLGLERIGIKTTPKGFISIDDCFRTSHPHIFAIGDVIEGTMLAHRSSAEGMALVESLSGKSTPLNYLTIPNIIYTDPEVATVGLSEKEAIGLGLEIVVGKSLFKANSRARCSSETEGVVKIIGDKKSGALLGLHIISAKASELIGEGVIALQKRATIHDLAYSIQGHPTLSEALKEAALDALGHPIHH